MNDTNFKYQSHIDNSINIGAVLPALTIPKNKCAYRYVFSENNINNHKPVYIQKPKRAISDIDKSKITTSGYSLSCFEEENSAINKFNKLQSNHRNISLTVGDALCSGLLNKNDGLVTQANSETHFDLYEFECCDLSKTFQIIKTLI